MRDDQQALRLSPGRFDGFQELAVKTVRGRDIEPGDVVDGGRVRVERLAQVCHALGDFGFAERDCGHRGRACFRNRPYIGSIGGDIERDQSLARAQPRAHLLDRRRLRIGQVGVIGKALLDLALQLTVLLAQRHDFRAQLADDLRELLRGRCRKHVLQEPRERSHAVLDVLLPARKLAQLRPDRGAGRTGRQRALHPAPARDIGKPKGLRQRLDALRRRIASGHIDEHADIAFEDLHEAPRPRGAPRFVAILGVVEQQRNRNAEFAQRRITLSGRGIGDSEETPGDRGLVMGLAEAVAPALDHAREHRDRLVRLAEARQRERPYDMTAAALLQQQRIAREALLDLLELGARFRPFALHGQHRSICSSYFKQVVRLRTRARFFENIDCLVRQYSDFTIAALIEEDACKLLKRRAGVHRVTARALQRALQR